MGWIGPGQGDRDGGRDLPGCRKTFVGVWGTGVGEGAIINRIGGRVSWRNGVVFQKNIKCVPADAESPLFRISEGLFPGAKEPIGVPIQK